jgi:hypothetical protein
MRFPTEDVGRQVLRRKLHNFHIAIFNFRPNLYVAGRDDDVYANLPGAGGPRL